MKRIVILGAESTGKSTLCIRLADHFRTIWCPEYARSYLTQHGMKYTYDDLLTIAKGQLALEDEYAKKIPSSSPGMLFIDTDMYVMKIWCEFVFEKCHRFILEQIATRKYDLYLLCNIDLPWTWDELREYPTEAPRQKLHKMYKDCLVNQNVPWVEISGDQQARLEAAITAVNKTL